MSQAPIQPAPKVLIYGDFNCPFSALAHARAERLTAAGHLSVDWRCVEHDPTIGPNESPLTSTQAAAFEAELRQIGELLGDDEANRFRVPSRRLNTRDLNQVYAAAPPADRQALRSAFFEAYWFDDRDLTSDPVIESIVDAVRSADSHSLEGRTATQIEGTVAAWQREWQDLPRPIVPVMVLADGGLSRGLGVLGRLASGTGDALSISTQLTPTD